MCHGEETIPEDEGKAIEELTKIQIEGMVLGATDEKPKHRGQHPKHHGFVVAGFSVRADIPEELKVGVFRDPRTYTAVIRFSNGDSADDAVPGVHGMAIKLFGVAGEKLLEAEKEAD